MRVPLKENRPKFWELSADLWSWRRVGLWSSYHKSCGHYQENATYLGICKWKAQYMGKYSEWDRPYSKKMTCFLGNSILPSLQKSDWFLANLKQKYTQSNGRRPFGISSLVVGFDPHTKKPHLFTTDPAGTYSEWRANAIGRSSKTVREFLEKNYKDEKQNTGLYTLTWTGRTSSSG